MFCRNICIIALLILFLSAYAWADSEAPPYPYVTTAEYSRYYFKMIPSDQYDREKGSGICYEATVDNKDKVLWKSNGWYSFEVYLSNDGMYLVRMGNWPRGHELSAQHLAIAFYKEGKLLKSYSTKDLVKNSSAIQVTVSHYFWKDKAPVFHAYEKRFQLVTIDKIEYVFDITNGEIISKKIKK